MYKPSTSYGERRRIINTNDAEYGVYDFEGQVLQGVRQLDLSYDRDTGLGAYMIRMAPGSATNPHVHTRREEYLVIEGDVVESDGTMLEPGDYVIYEPGTEHSIRTINGCVLIGFDRNPSSEA